MDTLNTPLASGAPSSGWPWPPAVPWLTALWERLGRSDEERFLSGATDLGDLEGRLKHLERHGLHPR